MGGTWLCRTVFLNLSGPIERPNKLLHLTESAWRLSEFTVSPAASAGELGVFACGGLSGGRVANDRGVPAATRSHAGVV
jgi:hypothetical protein